jgi:hypothetical protein
MGKKIIYKSPDKWETRVLNEFKFLKLINIHIYNNQVAIINGNSNLFMSKLPKFMHVNTRFKSLVGKDATLETITGFETKKQALEHLKEHYPDVINVSDKNLIEDAETYYKTLGQLDPETGQVLVVYKSMYGFAQYNKISTAQIERAVNNDDIVSGYKWKVYMEYDYPITTPDYKFVDPLNKGFNFVMKVKGRGFAKNIPVEKVDMKGNVVATYATRQAAALANGTNSTKMTLIMEKGKIYNGFYYRTK